MQEHRSALKPPLIIVLDNVRSMYNVGAVFRTADAFLAKALYLCGITGKPPHKELAKTALGATETVDWQYFHETKEAIELLRQDNYRIYAVEQCIGSIVLNEFFPQKKEKIALIFGNEVKGIEQGIIDLCDGCLEILQYGTKHSLNIAVTAGIVIWYFNGVQRSGVKVKNHAKTP